MVFHGAPRRGLVDALQHGELAHAGGAHSAVGGPAPRARTRVSSWLSGCAFLGKAFHRAIRIRPTVFGRKPLYIGGAQRLRVMRVKRHSEKITENGSRTRHFFVT